MRRWGAVLDVIQQIFFTNKFKACNFCVPEKIVMTENDTKIVNEVNLLPIAVTDMCKKLRWREKYFHFLTFMV